MERYHVPLIAAYRLALGGLSMVRGLSVNSCPHNPIIRAVFRLLTPYLVSSSLGRRSMTPMPAPGLSLLHFYVIRASPMGTR